MPQIIFYIIVYIMGVLIGSFLTLAIYRIPKKENITHTRSYCPHCNHRLNFLDLIPIISYIILKGKCRYCNEKIGSRYIKIELLSGLLYTLTIYSFKLNLYTLTISQLIFLIFVSIYYTVIMILAGIEKETKKISKSVLCFGIVIQIIYMTYLYILDISIYRYIIYLVAVLLLILISKKESTPLMFAIAIFSLILVNNSIGLIISAILSIINIMIYYLFTSNKHMHPVFNICITNVIILIMTNLIS